MAWSKKEIEICDEAGGSFHVLVHESQGQPDRFECRDPALVGAVISCESVYYKVTAKRPLPDRTIYDIKPLDKNMERVDSHDESEESE